MGKPDVSLEKIRGDFEHAQKVGDPAAGKYYALLRAMEQDPEKCPTIKAALAVRLIEEYRCHKKMKSSGVQNSKAEYQDWVEFSWKSNYMGLAEIDDIVEDEK